MQQLKIELVNSSISDQCLYVEPTSNVDIEFKKGLTSSEATITVSKEEKLEVYVISERSMNNGTNFRNEKIVYGIEKYVSENGKKYAESVCHFNSEDPRFKSKYLDFSELKQEIQSDFLKVS